MSQYITKESNNENIVEQKEMNGHTFSILIDKRYKEFEEVQLDFYFYSDDPVKLEKLAENLSSKGYEMDVVEESSSENEFVLDGTSIAINLSIENLNKWTTEMCNLGLSHDCEFSGWELEI
ncbi:ribonuclease E inhibitor RraB [Flavobacterium cerinum]|uniref:Ribonuclease E inhibitor RraB n=1 Tax=Flavobacterium cerinum TaxID=2502784 RepID=A0A3S3QTP2_9FLAO|nr:ribonuclease E inhibitor RraB [Flavobacterium cerinum]RWW91791.1 ribonuclease E inhibitor RraB [Flavobacterium cerinum]